MELSVRLRTIADLVTPGNTVADVGCDHGFVSIYLYENRIAPKVYAMDLRKGPLSRAKDHIKQKGYEAYIETRLSDGVQALQAGEAMTLICAGMGGRLIADILSDGMEKIKIMKELILGPQSDLAYFRRFLRENHLEILQEEMVKEEGKFYPIIKAAYKNNERKEENFPGAGPYLPTDFEGKEISPEFLQNLLDAYGPLLLRNKNHVLKDFLMTRFQLNEAILRGLEKSTAGERKIELQKEQEGIRICLETMED